MQSTKAIDQVIQRLDELKTMLSGDENSLKSDMRKSFTSLENRLTNIEAGTERLLNMTLALIPTLFLGLVWFLAGAGMTWLFACWQMLR